MIQRKKNIAVIPAKGFSGRLKNKNILDFHGNPLVVHKINQLKAVNEIDEIVVSSDCEKILSLARSHDVTALKRPHKYTLDDVKISEFFRYIADVLDGENIIWACCTSPLVGSELIKQALLQYNKNVPQHHDSLITVYEYQHYLLDENGPMNFEIGDNHKYSQDLPKLDLFTNGVLIAPRTGYKKWGSNFGPNPFRMKVTQKQAVDIDTPTDFEIAKALWDSEL